MPSTTHKFITILLFLVAIGLCIFNEAYRSAHPLSKVNVGTTWGFVHRGYPSQFGYLSNYWDLRVVETHGQIYIDTDTRIYALAFKLYNSEKMIGEFSIQFNVDWELKENYLYVSVLEQSIQINYVSEGFDIEPVRGMLIDFIHDISKSPRELISKTNQELVFDIPYLGITRTKRLPEPTLIQF
ncbi:hypothetical protein GT360_18750 [Vibrio astriarenae]|uniref:Uncharacterized protein n=1 Tax=Vibrio astriarenae TaxID=1481923 RepID=A0A7Z2T7D6_9VIBR|nr:hypothetical protein [Vibrio astriarenae]QIA65572.1 hypothetical protein GT360_18750 [Vibrio astriarenae]